MAYDAREVANFFLDAAQRRGVPLTNMSLLKILYFTQGWYLLESNLPFIQNAFEAWENGPVVRIVYEGCKKWRDQPIEDRLTKPNFDTGATEVASYSFSEDEKAFLERMLAMYGGLHAYRLSNMTHDEDGPWDLIWNAKLQDFNPGMRIPNSLIKESFKKASSRQHLS